MTARAIWKGHLALGKEAVAVKMYSAVQDQAVHFHLLHEKDLTPVEQRIVRKDNGREVAKEAQRKAFPLDDQRAVILEPAELEALEPAADRAIRLLRFVPRDALGDAWFDRPYSSARTTTTAPTSPWRRPWAITTASASRAGSCATRPISARCRSRKGTCA